MKVKRILDRKTRAIGACLAMVMAWAVLTRAPLSQAQTAPANLSPDLQEIVKLTQAHMGDDVLLTYIKNSGKAYNLSADDMVYLKSQGISDTVLNAVMQNKPRAPIYTPPPAPAPAPAPALGPAQQPVSVPPPTPPGEPG